MSDKCHMLWYEPRQGINKINKPYKFYFMKNFILATLLLVALFITVTTNAQVGIGVSTANINPSAQLDVTSTTKGFCRRA